VIGEFSHDNNYTLSLDDDDVEPGPGRASMLIVEPFILLPTTQIVKTFPCARSAMFQHQFKGQSSDINYALVLGNVIHNVFQRILEQMDFRQSALDVIIKKSV